MHNPNIQRNVPAPPQPPAQKPTDFASLTVILANELNDRLVNLRFRLFGDQQSPAGEALPGQPDRTEPSLESLVQRAHYLVNEAILQIDAIQNRL